MLVANLSFGECEKSKSFLGSFFPVKLAARESGSLYQFHKEEKDCEAVYREAWKNFFSWFASFYADLKKMEEAFAQKGGRCKKGDSLFGIAVSLYLYDADPLFFEREENSKGDDSDRFFYFQVTLSVKEIEGLVERYSKAGELEYSGAFWEIISQMYEIRKTILREKVNTYIEDPSWELFLNDYLRDGRNVQRDAFLLEKSEKEEAERHRKEKGRE